MKQEIDILYQKFLLCTGVSIDTRTMEEGNLFFGIRGPNFDGNEYASKALENGAKFAVVDRKPESNDDRFIEVEDSLLALQHLALHRRKKFGGRVVGLTGSNGKTTTKELLVRVLETQFTVQGTRGNLNNHLGVPLTILELNDDTDIAVIEMGANKVGDIAELCDIALPTHGLITNIGIAHAEGFGGREGVIRGKSELFDFIRKTNGTVFINQHDHILLNMAKRFDNPHLYPNQVCNFIEANPFVAYKSGDQEYQTNMIGEYNFLNIAAALCVGNFFDVDMGKANDAISAYIPSNNRSQIIEMGSNQIILDAYNANPDSMKAAIDTLIHLKADNKIVLLGSMKEMGDISDEVHLEIVNATESNAIQMKKFVGEEFQKSRPNENGTDFFNKTDDLIIYLKQHPISNSTVLIKGSRSIEMEKLVKVPEIWN